MACDEDRDDSLNRVAKTITSPDGYQIHYMPIYEPGVTDITIRIAWPHFWPRDPDLNPAVPLIAVSTLQAADTADL